MGIRRWFNKHFPPVQRCDFCDGMLMYSEIEHKVGRCTPQWLSKEDMRLLMVTEGQMRSEGSL